MKKIIALLAVAAALSACKKDSFDTPDGNYDPSKIITVEPSATESQTKGTMIGSEAGMTTLGIFCSYTGQSDWTAAAAPGKMFNRQMSRSASGQWLYTGGNPEKWDAAKADDRFTFFSYAPFATGNYDPSGNPAGNGIVVNGSSASPGIPTITYTVPSNCPNQPDLLVATIRQDIRQSPSPVALSMHHALTSVGFRMNGLGQTVTRITVKGVKSTGTLALDGASVAWTNVGGSSDLDVKINTGVTLDPTGQRINTADGYLMMIPQTLGPDAKVEVGLADGTTRTASLNTQLWEPGKHIDYVMTITPSGIITVLPSVIYIPAGGSVWGTEFISVVSGTPAQPWTLAATDSWLQMSLNPTGAGAGQTVSSQDTKLVYVNAAANTTGADRTTTITLDNGTVVTVTQIRDIDPSSFISGGILPTGVGTYVGAFWKSAQTGERIIRIPMGPLALNLGPWTASVAWMDSGWAPGDIVLSADSTADPNVDFTAIKTPGDAESYQVNSNRSVVWGTVAANGALYFRVGLKSTFTPTDALPARYAVLLLRYGTPLKEQLLYLRQGEDPDYLMRPNEIGTPGSTITTRPNAVKFSPYNLTAPNMTAGGALVANHPKLAPYGGTFTQFPTQTGAFFQWASTLNPLVAYNPSNPTGAITNWSNLIPLEPWTGGLSSLSTTQESCPQGYTLGSGASANFRRPNNGITNAILATPLLSNSEILQSLWLAPQPVSVPATINVAYGYYADGYFDRRMLQSSTIGLLHSTNSVVSLGTNDVASMGALFVNPVTNASLFFPSSGLRSPITPPNGALNDVGQSGTYWTSTSLTLDMAWVFTVGDYTGLAPDLSVIAFQATMPKSAGLLIRCVRN